MSYFRNYATNCMLELNDMSSNGLENGYGIHGTVDAGSNTNPYAINDFADLNAVKNYISNGAYYQQTVNIELSSSLPFSGFVGHYNGNGYEIDGKSEYYILFKTPKDSTGKYISDTTIEKCVFKNLTSRIMHGGSMKNCIIQNATISGGGQQSIAYMEYNNSYHGGYYSTSVENCIAVNCNITSTNHAYQIRYPAVFVGSADDSIDKTHSYCKNSVSINSTAKNNDGDYAYQIGYSGAMLLSNNYSTAGSSSTIDSNGMLINETLYKNSDFWFNNVGGSLSQAYLDYDVDIWEWGDDLPKLRHTPIVNAKLKLNGEWYDGIPHIKINNVWKQTDAVYVKVNGEWK